MVFDLLTVAERRLASTRWDTRESRRLAPSPRALSENPTHDRTPSPEQLVEGCGSKNSGRRTSPGSR